MNVLDAVNNRVGVFVSASAPVPAGTSSATLSAVMTAAEAHDPTDTLRLGVEADFGAGFRHMGWSPVWTGGPGQTAPSLVWQFNPAHPPQRVRGVLENITQVVAGLDLSFA